MNTALDLIAEARRRGLTLFAKENGNLGFKPASACSTFFRETLAAHKGELLALLGTKWLQVYSERIGETLFFCENEQARDALVEAGASPWSIYTKDELRTLCAQNRIAPLELSKVHEAKGAFNGKITQCDL